MEAGGGHDWEVEKCWRWDDEPRVGLWGYGAGHQIMYEEYHETKLTRLQRLGNKDTDFFFHGLFNYLHHPGTLIKNIKNYQFVNFFQQIIWNSDKTGERKRGSTETSRHEEIRPSPRPSVPLLWPHTRSAGAGGGWSCEYGLSRQSESETIIQVTWFILTNQRPV